MILIIYIILCIAFSVYIFIKEVALQQGYIDVWDVIFLITLAAFSPILAPIIFITYCFKKYKIGEIKIWEKK